MRAWTRLRIWCYRDIRWVPTALTFSASVFRRKRYATHTGTMLPAGIRLLIEVRPTGRFEQAVMFR